MHEHNCLLLLTYAPEHLPPGGTLVRLHHQKFMRALRKKTGKKIRFYMCGEYGHRFERPHYHTILFGHEFEDKKQYKMSPSGYPLYKSDTLTKLWGRGHADIAGVSLKTAQYVARYVMKKIMGEHAQDHYLKIDTETGECWPVIPEYTTMSLRPGIGYSWFQKYYADVFPDDYVIVDGQRRRTPRYYTNLLRRLDPDEYARIKEKRMQNMLKNAEDNTYERLSVREECKAIQLKKLERDYEK